MKPDPNGRTSVPVGVISLIEQHSLISLLTDSAVANESLSGTLPPDADFTLRFRETAFGVYYDRSRQSQWVPTLPD